MRFGIALPNQVVGTTRQDLVGFVDRAERSGFASIWTLDRLVYGGFSSLPLLAWVAGQTEKARLGTSILLAPLYSPLVLAKEAATIDHLSQGRLTLGLGLGGRADDFQAAGVSMGQRGLLMEDTVTLLRQAWSGQPIAHAGRAVTVDVGPIGPRPGQASGPPLWLGGSDPRAVNRAARLGDGYVAGGGGPAAAHKVIPAVRQAVKEVGRDPASFPCASLVYFSLGADVDQAAARVADYVQRYYGRQIMDPRQGAIVGPTSAAVQRIREYEDLDLDTLICVPVSREPEQVDRLAEAVRAMAG